MGFDKAFYIVNENTKYVELEKGRFDVGCFYVERCYLEGFKNIAKYFSEWCKESIEQYVFEDEKQANETALKLTLEKLSRIGLE